MIGLGLLAAAIAALDPLGHPHGAGSRTGS